MGATRGAVGRLFPPSDEGVTSWTPPRVATAVVLTASFALLVVVGAAGESAAKPGLGPAVAGIPHDWSWAPGPGLVTGLLWAAYLLGALGVLLHLRHGLPQRAQGVLGLLVVLAVVTLTSPFGSADHTNYAAYGQIAAHGGDPYLTPPNAWSPTDPVTSAVRPPWDGTVSIYGPFATVLQALAAHLGQDSMRQTVWVWQLMVLFAWGVTTWAITALVGSAPGRRRVEALWALNPVVVGVAVLGAHVELVAVALVLLAVWASSRSTWVAGVFAGLAVSTKFTVGVAVLALLLAWWVHERPGFVRRAAILVASLLAVVVPLHWWAGPHVFDQLDRARRSVSLATPWRLLLEALDGPLSNAGARDLITALALALFVVLVLVLTRLTRGLAPATTLGTAARGTFVLSTAYALSAPYSLPWYLVLTWATLPVLAASVLDRALLLHFVAMTLAYVPGRVEAMTPAVERATLWVRRSVVPYAVLLVWGWLTLAAARVWRRSPSPRPPGP